MSRIIKADNITLTIDGKVVGTAKDKISFKMPKTRERAPRSTATIKGTMSFKEGEGHLDFMAKLYGLERKKGETEDQLRARLLERLRPKYEYGSREWIIQTIKKFVPGHVFIQNKRHFPPDGIIYVSLHRKHIKRLNKNKAFFNTMPVCYYWKFLPKSNETLRAMKKECALHIEDCPYFISEKNDKG